MFETLKNLLVEELQLNPDEITLESDLANDLGVNSIELADMIMICEDKFGVEIKDEDIFKFVNVGDVVKAVCLGKDKMGRISFSMKDVKAE